MGYIHKIGKCLRQPQRIGLWLAQHRLLPLSDVQFMKLFYQVKTGHKLNLAHPQTFNEKVQWLKLYDRNPLYPQYVDKYQAKQLIVARFGAKYVSPLLGVWERVEDIDLGQLPAQFVLKTTHDSGGVVVCHAKEDLNWAQTQSFLRKRLKTNYYYASREWVYKDLHPRIIAEQYLDDGSGNGVMDYKVFLFNGLPYCIQVDYDRFHNHRRNFYSVDWEYLPFTTAYPTDPNHVVVRPTCLKAMLANAQEIGAMLGQPALLRVDYYIIQDRFYFGEVTFYHGAGQERFDPPEWDAKLGAKLVLKRGEMK